MCVYIFFIVFLPSPLFNVSDYMFCLIPSIFSPGFINKMLADIEPSGECYKKQMDITSVMVGDKSPKSFISLAKHLNPRVSILVSG